MSSAFLLVETQPGRERDVYTRLGRVPGIKSRASLFPGNLAVKLVCRDRDMLRTAARIRRLGGVVDARLYPARGGPARAS